MSDFNQENLHPLVSLVQSRFNQAKLAKQKIEDRMIESLYYYKIKYMPEKLKAIREATSGGSEIFIPLVNIKCRALQAWLSDVFFPESGDPPFDIEPTPVPDLPLDKDEEFAARLRERIATLITEFTKLSLISGGQINPQVVQERLPEIIETEKERYRSEILEYSRRVAEYAKRVLHDQLIEGGFFQALDETIRDIAIFPSAFMKSCVPRKVKTFGDNRTVETKIIPTFNRVSPFDIYPSPTASDLSDWVIEILHLTPQDLDSLRDVDGFDEAMIDTVLGLYEDTGYRLSAESRQSERFLLEGKSDYEYNLIDVIEFWGSIKGSYLKDFLDDIEENRYYEVAIWMCDNYLLKVTLNPDPLGYKPYHKASFVEIPDSFWGYSLVDVLRSLQDGVNAVSRAIINNAALSSGPMIERNVDRIPRDEPKEVRPWKIFDSHDMAMAGTPAYRFYQPSVTANALVQVMMYFMKMADELSGVPPYAHALLTSGGSARTASGLSMLMESSSRGIKDAVRNIDVGIIEPTISRLYYLNVSNFYGQIRDLPDLNIRAKGSISLMNRIAQVQKMLQLLQITSNPVDMQLVGLEGRKAMLESIFRSFGVNVPIHPEADQIIQALQAQLQQQQMPAQPQQIPALSDNAPVTDQAQELRLSEMDRGVGMQQT